MLKPRVSSAVAGAAAYGFASAYGACGWVGVAVVMVSFSCSWGVIPRYERRIGRGMGLSPASARRRARSAEEEEDVLAHDEVDAEDHRDGAHYEARPGADQRCTLLPVTERRLLGSLRRPLLSLADLGGRDHGDGIGELGGGHDRRAARERQEADAERVGDDDDDRAEERRHEHDDECEPVDHGATFRLGLGLRLIFTALPEAATSLTTFLCDTSLRRDQRKIVAITAAPATASMMTPTTPCSAMNAASAPTAPAAGRVSSHPMPIRPAVRQRTFEPRRPRPDPMTEPDATCVVESAKPRCVEARIVAAVDVSAAKPCAGFTSVRPVPRVLMMRHPPM